eukprot:jgi/Bigna1/142441/aug1.70_g17149
MYQLCTSTKYHICATTQQSVNHQNCLCRKHNNIAVRDYGIPRTSDYYSHHPKHEYDQSGQLFMFLSDKQVKISRSRSQAKMWQNTTNINYRLPGCGSGTRRGKGDKTLGYGWGVVKKPKMLNIPSDSAENGKSKKDAADYQDGNRSRFKRIPIMLRRSGKKINVKPRNLLLLRSEERESILRSERKGIIATKSRCQRMAERFSKALRIDDPTAAVSFLENNNRPRVARCSMKAMLSILKRILKRPKCRRARTIPLKSIVFTKLVQNVRGAQEILQIVGFKKIPSSSDHGSHPPSSLLMGSPVNVPIMLRVVNSLKAGIQRVKAASNREDAKLKEAASSSSSFSHPLSQQPPVDIDAYSDVRDLQDLLDSVKLGRGEGGKSRYAQREDDFGSLFDFLFSDGEGEKKSAPDGKNDMKIERRRLCEEAAEQHFEESDGTHATQSIHGNEGEGEEEEKKKRSREGQSNVVAVIRVFPCSVLAARKLDSKARPPTPFDHWSTCPSMEN